MSKIISNFARRLVTSAGGSLVGWMQAGAGAVLRTILQKFSESVSVKDFGAAGDGIADDTAAIQLACNAAFLLKCPVWFPAGTYKITSTIDAKTMPLYGCDRLYSKLLCNVATGTRTFSNVGQVVQDLYFMGQGGGPLPDGFATSGYKRYIIRCYFNQMGACFCPTDIVVTTIIDGCEFLACDVVLDDKLTDGTSAHTTLFFVNNNVLYGTSAFKLKTEVIGWELVNNVFEDMQFIFNGTANKQIAGCTIKGAWIEQVNHSCTIFSNVYAGSTNVFENVKTRNGTLGQQIYDVSKIVPAQFALSGGGGGGGGGVVTDASGTRIADFNGNGILLTAAGIKPAAAMANFYLATDIIHATQAANANYASRGGDYIISTGAGSNGQRKGAIRPDDNQATNLGDTANRWATAYCQNVVMSPPSVAVPASNGDMTFELTTNTTMKINVKGSDGVIRSAVLALA